MKRTHVVVALIGAAAIVLILALVFTSDPSPAPPADKTDPRGATPTPSGSTDHPSIPRDAGTTGVDSVVGPTWDEVEASATKSREQRPADLTEGACREDRHCSATGGLLRCDADRGKCAEPQICVGDKDCVGARVCARGVCLDELPGCRARECMPGHCVHTAGECEFNPCKSDKDCAGTRHCDMSIGGECRDCLANTDCGSGKICNGGECKRPDHCIGDGTCEGASVCNRVTGDCVSPACPPDPNEPNNDRKRATVLPTATPVAGEICPDTDEEDWYSLDVIQGDGFVVAMTFNPDHGTVEIRYTDRDGKEIGRAGDVERQGYIQVVVPKAELDGPYYVRAKFTQGVPTPYTIEWTSIAGGFCNDDFFEPNERLDDAAELPGARPWDLKLCGQDDDWFSQEIQPGQEIDVTLFQRNNLPVPIIELYDDTTLRRVARDDSADATKTITYKATHAGNVFVRVTQEDPDADTDYAIRFVPR